MIQQRWTRVLGPTLLTLLAIWVGSGADPASSQESLYKLPYPAGKEYKCTQGNDIGEEEGGSHFGKPKYAFDFDSSFDHGLVVASRGGKVLYVKEDSKQGGCAVRYGNSANYVIVDHGDGTSALYLHLEYESILVEEGQSIAQGETIGRADSTGYVCGAHLHFQVQKTPGDRSHWYTQSVPITFSDADVLTKDPDGIPKAGQRYKSDNSLAAATCPPEGQPEFAQGDMVFATDDLRAREHAGTTHPAVATVAKGTSGKVLEGPVCADGYVWWRIEYENGAIGWSAQGWLESRTTFTDPFAYCAAVGTIDEPDNRYIGGAEGDAVLWARLGWKVDQTFRRLWRCLEGKVLACQTDMYFAGCGRYPSPPKPAEEMFYMPAIAEFCSRNPDSALVPFFVTGHGPSVYVYNWRCEGTKATAYYVGDFDARGFVVDRWGEVPAAPTSSPPGGVAADLWQFAGQVNEALATSDVTFFIQMTAIQEIPCGFFGPMPPECEGDFDKEVMGIMDGVPGAFAGAWTPAQYEANLGKWFSEAKDGAQDDIGSGRFQVHGIMLEERPTLVATYMMTGTLRQIVRFQLEQQEGQWRIAAVHWGAAAGPSPSQLLELWESDPTVNYVRWPDFN